MTDALELLSRRNPVDEAAMPARDARATEDLAQIMSEPIPQVRGPRRATPRAVRLAAATAGVAGIAVLMGGLFLFRPGDSGHPSAPLGPGEWALEATIRVEPAPGGLGLEQATRRAAEIIRARADALHRVGVTADPTGPGTVRVVIPWGTTPSDAGAFTYATNLSLVDLGARTVADTLHEPHTVMRWLEGSVHAGPPGEEWVPVSGRGTILSGPLATRPDDRYFRGATWLRPPKGVHLVVVPRAALRRAGDGSGPDLRPAYAVVLGPPAVRADDVVAAVRDGAHLRLTLRNAITVAGRTTYATSSGSVVGRALPTRGPSREVVLVAAGPYEIPPGLHAAGFAGGGLDARLTVEATRSIGTPPARTGTPSAIVPELRRRYARSRVFISDPRPAPRWSTALDVLVTTTPAGTWRLTEVLTDSQDIPLGFLTGPHDAQTGGCVLGPAASIIRACDRSGAHVIGRAAPKVESVEVRYRSGAVRRAVVQNGWFLLLAGRGDGAKLVALDRDGKVLREIPR